MPDNKTPQQRLYDAFTQRPPGKYTDDVLLGMFGALYRNAFGHPFICEARDLLDLTCEQALQAFEILGLNKPLDSDTALQLVAAEQPS